MSGRRGAFDLPFQTQHNQFTWEVPQGSTQQEGGRAPPPGLTLMWIYLTPSVFPGWPQAKMMGRKALEAAQILVADLQLEGRITPEQFLVEREEVGISPLISTPSLV